MNELPEFKKSPPIICMIIIAGTTIDHSKGLDDLEFEEFNNLLMKVVAVYTGA